MVVGTQQWVNWKVAHQLADTFASRIYTNNLSNNDPSLIAKDLGFVYDDVVEGRNVEGFMHLPPTTEPSCSSTTHTIKANFEAFAQTCKALYDKTTTKREQCAISILLQLVNEQCSKMMRQHEACARWRREAEVRRAKRQSRNLYIRSLLDRLGLDKNVVQLIHDFRELSTKDLMQLIVSSSSTL